MGPVTCAVDGCTTRLQPLWKPDPQDRESWVYRECDQCFRPVCEKHSAEMAGRILCDTCRAQLETPEILDLGIRLPQEKKEP